MSAISSDRKSAKLVGCSTSMTSSIRVTSMLPILIMWLPLTLNRLRSVGNAERDPAVDHDVSPRAVLGRGRRKEQPRALHVVGGPHAVLRRELGEECLVARVLQAPAADIGHAWTRGDCVHRNVVAGELERDLADRLGDTGLGHHIGCANEL